jgi:hypothetical protein
LRLAALVPEKLAEMDETIALKNDRRDANALALVRIEQAMTAARGGGEGLACFGARLRRQATIDAITRKQNRRIRRSHSLTEMSHARPN